MRVSVKQSFNWMDRVRKKMTYQAEFPETVKCCCCKKETVLMMLIDDDEGLICHYRPKIVTGVWPHDCLAIALYLCTDCGEITALWNQG